LRYICNQAVGAGWCLASDYVDAYGKQANLDRDSIMAWLPFVAAARLAEGVTGATDGLLTMVDAGLARLGA